MNFKDIVLIPMLCILVFAFCSCANEDLMLSSITQLEEQPVQISIDSVQGITEKAAIDLCNEALGTKDDVTGNLLSYRCVGALEHKKVQYYVVNVTWLVDEHHWSYVGNLLVSVDGNTIYDGLEKDKQYFFGEKRWQR